MSTVVLQVLDSYYNYRHVNRCSEGQILFDMRSLDSYPQSLSSLIDGLPWGFAHLLHPDSPHNFCCSSVCYKTSKMMR